MSSLPALNKFFLKYQQDYIEKSGELPRYFPQGQISDCVIDEDIDKVGDNCNVAVQWRAVKRQSVGVFSNVERALELVLHESIDNFYGRHFAAPLWFDSCWGQGVLQQVWNNDDFEFLQQNIIGHLLMKQKAKQSITWFIGLMDEDEQMVVVDNNDGSVWIEIPGQKPHKKLADSLDIFIEHLTPRICQPVDPSEEVSLPNDDLGMWSRLKLLWSHLTHKKD